VKSDSIFPERDLARIAVVLRADPGRQVVSENEWCSWVTVHIPGTSHGLLVKKPDLCNHVVMQFLTQDPVMAYAPIRRTEH
jgi:hypothetical protein